MLANAALLRRQVDEAEGEAVGASARLCRLLNLDPAVRLRTPGGPVEPFRLVAEDTDLELLVAEAVRSRPEMYARSAAFRRLRSVFARNGSGPGSPCLPSATAMDSSAAGARERRELSPLTGRNDVTVMASGTFRTSASETLPGSTRRAQLSGKSKPVLRPPPTRSSGRWPKPRPQPRPQPDRSPSARAALTAAEEGFRLETDRIQQGQGRPIEALDSFRQLLDAREELLRAVIAFDIAQFRLFVGSGQQPGDRSAMAREPGA